MDVCDACTQYVRTEYVCTVLCISFVIVTQNILSYFICATYLLYLFGDDTQYLRVSYNQTTAVVYDQLHYFVTHLERTFRKMLLLKESFKRILMESSGIFRDNMSNWQFCKVFLNRIQRLPKNPWPCVLNHEYDNPKYFSFPAGTCTWTYMELHVFESTVKA